MAYILICRDKADALDVRKGNRERHLAYIAAQGAQVLLAGPMLDHAGSPIGSLIVLDVEDRAAAERFANADPYAEAGLFAEVTVEGFNPVRGRYVG